MIILSLFRWFIDLLSGPMFTIAEAISGLTTNNWLNRSIVMIAKFNYYLPLQEFGELLGIIFGLIVVGWVIRALLELL